MSNTLTSKNERNSSLELLRIIAMFMIIGHHFAVHGSFSFAPGLLTVNRLWILFIQIGGKIGVDVFVMISGFFLITSTQFHISKLLKLWIQLFTYSTAIYLISVYTGFTTFNLTDFLSYCLPVTYSKWWFATGYFVLYLFSPFLNKLLQSLSQKEYFSLLCLAAVVWCLIPTFLLETAINANNLLWFMYIYALAGYIRLWGPSLKTHCSFAKAMILAVFFIVLTYLSTVLLNVLGVHNELIQDNYTHFYKQESLLIVLITLFLFIGFKNLELKTNRMINMVSATTFGIYLIHDNRIVRNFLWSILFKNASFSDSQILIPYSLMAIISVFAVCSLIELIRINVLEKLYLNCLKSLSSRLDTFLSAIQTWLLNKL